MDDPVLVARDLMADGSQGRIFGPVDLTLYPRQICLVTGPSGSGRSSLLLALCGRFRPATGDLEICGVDAMAHPYDVLEHTTIARLGDFVGPEDRLTLRESILDRAYIEGISPQTALDRAELMAEALGVRGDSEALLEDMSAFERAVVAVALSLVRPASVIALDDADMRIRHRDLPRLYAALERLLAIDDAALVMSVSDEECAPAGAAIVNLDRNVVPAFEPDPAVSGGEAGDDPGAEGGTDQDGSQARTAAMPAAPDAAPDSPLGAAPDTSPDAPAGPGRHDAPAPPPGGRSRMLRLHRGPRSRPAPAGPDGPADTPSTPADS